MKGYKILAKSAALQFPFEIDVSCNVNDAEWSKENHREVLEGSNEEEKVTKKKKKIRAIEMKTKKSSARKHRVKKRDVFDIFS